MRREKAKTEAAVENPGKEMTLSGHLRELRNRLLVCVVLLAAAVIAGLHYAPRIVEMLLGIGMEYGYRFVYISPQELLMQYFSAALVFGLCVTIPVLSYECWAFIQPGLKRGENHLFLFAMLFGLLCFCVGVMFAYKVMMPFMLGFLTDLSGSSIAAASISVQNYITFFTTIFLVFGFMFELPVVAMLLTQIGLVKISWMRKGRRVVIVLVFFVAAVITPPDVVSQIMVAIPMMGLYELSIIICSVCEKFKKTKEDSPSEDNGTEE